MKIQLLIIFIEISHKILKINWRRERVDGYLERIRSLLVIMVVENLLLLPILLWALAFPTPQIKLILL